MRYPRPFAAAVLAALFVACGGSSQPGPSKDVLGKDAPALDTSIPDPGPGTPDVPADPDLPPAIDVYYDHGPQPEIAEETIDDADAIEPGEFGWPCKQNGECLSGFCVDTSDGRICTQVCSGECPVGWLCRNFTLGPDIYSICVPRYDRLCDPCFENKDCNADYSAGGASCVDMGKDGRFCGGDCSIDSVCPSGYTCKEAVDGNGKKSLQCVPEDGQCECSVRATDLGLSTECRLENEFGKCTGERRCGPDGTLSTCDVHEPAAETCNKIDDDCNGYTDDLAEPPTCSTKNGFGECFGTGLCVAGQVDCKAPTPAPETCNGIDDDCDGSTDNGICLSESQCQEGKCDVGANRCIFIEKTGACDDGNACTKNDHCEAGACVAGSAKPCDDGNPCTTDSCDSGSGECVHENHEGACEDGDPCTVNDTCSAGVCTAGLPKDCSDTNMCTANERCESAKGGCTYDVTNANCTDGNPCTADTCDPNTGTCVFPNVAGVCDDGNSCTTGDHCVDGACLGDAMDCEDNNDCTLDACSGGKCTHTATNNGVACEDGNLCTTGTKCSAGKCLGGSTKSCADVDPCTVNEHCDPATGNCLAQDDCQLKCASDYPGMNCLQSTCVPITDWLTLCGCVCF